MPGVAYSRRPAGTAVSNATSRKSPTPAVMGLDRSCSLQRLRRVRVTPCGGTSLRKGARTKRETVAKGSVVLQEFVIRSPHRRSRVKKWAKTAYTAPLSRALGALGPVRVPCVCPGSPRCLFTGYCIEASQLVSQTHKYLNKHDYCRACLLNRSSVQFSMKNPQTFDQNLFRLLTHARSSA